MALGDQITRPTNPSAPHWKKAAAAVEGTHLDDVRHMVSQFRDSSRVLLEGTALTVAHVAAVSRRPDVAVELDEAAAKPRVSRSAAWVPDKIARGADIYGITTGFGSTCHRRTHKTAELQTELIRFHNAGVLGRDPLPRGYAKAAMLVRANSLLRGYSGIRFEVLDAMAKLMNENLIPKLPLRGTVTASGDLLPLSYIAGLLIGRHNSRVVTGDGEEITSSEALKRAGIPRPFELRAKEGLALVNGTAVAAAVAATVCYDANVLAVLAEVLSAMFCEVMHGRPEFADPLTHELKHHPGQIEAGAVMKFLLDESDYVREATVRHERDPLTKPKQDKYALRTSPQWLGPQIEVIRNATRVVEREINSVSDNPLIDVDRDVALHGGNFQGTPVGVSMDNLRLAVAAVGKLMFAQMSELVCEHFNNGLPSNLSGGPDPSLDFGLKGAEIAMAAYCSELLHLANPVTTHVQSAEQHTQDVNSLGLISARKSAEAVEILKLMSATYMVALCQAVDLRHLEEHMARSIRDIVVEASRKTLAEGYFCEEDLARVIDHLDVFSYLDEPTSPSYSLMIKLRDVLVQKALEGEKEDGYAAFERIPVFEEEVKKRLEEEVPAARERFYGGDFVVGNRIEKCRTSPVYGFVRKEVGTELLRGGKKESPGEYIEKVYEAIAEDRLGEVVVKCLASCRALAELN